VDFLDNSLMVWIVIAVVGLFVLRVFLKVTKNILKLGFMIALAVAVYLYISQYLSPAGINIP